MGDVETIPIARTVPLETIETEIDRLDSVAGKTLSKTRRRLELVRLRYKGYSMAEATTILGVNLQTGYNWQAIWNEKGMDGLAPRVSTGRPGKLTKEQKEVFVKAVVSEMMTTNEARAFVKERFGVEYTYKQVDLILKKAGLRHAKPYDIDFRRPEDAEAVLKKTSEMCWIR